MFSFFTSCFITGRPKRLFVFVNPFGGKKSASKIFLDDVKPLLEDANVEFTLQGLKFIILSPGTVLLWDVTLIFIDFILSLSETKHQLHAKEVVQTLDLSKYDGIVCVSGDGVLVEVGCLLCELLYENTYYIYVCVYIFRITASSSNIIRYYSKL